MDLYYSYFSEYQNDTSVMKLLSTFLKWHNEFAYANVIGVPILTVVTIITNIMTITGFLKHRGQWSKHHIYMMGMSLVDCFTVLTYLFNTVFQYYLHYVTNGKSYISVEGSNGRLICSFILSNMVFWGTTSVGCLLCVGFDRVHALYFPFEYRKLTNGHSKRVFSAMLLINFVLTIPVMVFAAPVKSPLFNNGFMICGFPDNHRVYSILVLHLYSRGIMPVFVLLFVNIVVNYKVVKIYQTNISEKRKNNNQPISKDSNSESKQMLRAARASLVLIFMSLFYILTLGPYAIASLVALLLYYDSNYALQISKRENFIFLAAQDGFWVLALVAFSFNFLIYFNEVGYLTQQWLEWFPWCRSKDKKKKGGSFTTKGTSVGFTSSAATTD